MAITTYITFGEISKNKFGSPVLPVHTVTRGDERTYYLMFFRGCMFQVCMSINGEGDAGSTDVIPEFARENATILKAFAIEALTRFGSNNYSDIRFSLNFEKHLQLDEFVKAVINR